ncbi:Phage Mu protein F like protein [Lactobacillus brevis ATCC 367] [Lactiplantibacillus mudanjiangensis]|nr:Phage Mu protein F like protein [Lactobacillus brevis ATCC 367] [Lactiplantibacillus mudanjiangensis]
MLTVKQERAYIDRMIAEDKALNGQKNLYYQQALLEIRNHLNRFYLAYQENEVLSIGDLLSSNSRDDQFDYQQTAQMVQPTDKESNKRKRELNATAGFDKMHLLMALIGLSVLGATIKTQKLLDDSLHDEFNTEVRRQYSNLPVHKQEPTIKASDLVFSDAKLSKYGDIDRILGQADKIIPTTVKGEQWSNTIWIYNDSLVNNVQNIVKKSLLGGLNSNDLNKLFDNIQPTPHTITGAIQQTDKVIERIIRTERARVMDRAQMAVFKDQGVQWFNWVTEAGACGKCIDLESGSPYRVSAPDSPTIPESSHANCRCSKVATDGPNVELIKDVAQTAPMLMSATDKAE